MEEVRTNRTYKIIRFGSRYVNTQNCGTWLAQMPTIIKRRCTVKNVLTMMMVICLTLPANAVAAQSAKLNTLRIRSTVNREQKTGILDKNVNISVVAIYAGLFLLTVGCFFMPLGVNEKIDEARNQERLEKIYDGIMAELKARYKKEFRRGFHFN
jgi:hypothetical protein